MFKLFSVFLVLTLISVNSKVVGDRGRAIEKIPNKFLDVFSQYQCSKVKTCKRSGLKVCAYDQVTSDLSLFNDKCDVYITNCKKENLYFIIPLLPCDSKKFETEYVMEYLAYPLVSKQKIKLANVIKLF